MDARILQSMLRDNKLDLEQNQNMKKLLERGIKKDEKLNDLQNNDDEVDDDETPYSSQVIKKLADTKFWQALSRNAADVFESVAIAATNQLEKSAKVLVGLGFFAWERAKQDAARALPTAGTASVPKKKVFQISDASSYVEPTQQDEQEEGKRNIGSSISVKMNAKMTLEKNGNKKINCVCVCVCVIAAATVTTSLGSPYLPYLVRTCIVHFYK